MKATELSIKGAKIRLVLVCIYLLLVIIRGMWETPFIWIKIVENSKTHWVISVLISFVLMIFIIFYGVIIYIVYKKTKAKNEVK